MKTYTLNIGMNGNPMTIGQTIAHIHHAFKPAIIKYRVDQGEWEGQPEDTLVVQLSTPIPQRAVYVIIEILTEVFNQTCIAVCPDDGVGTLVYNHYFKGEKVAFDHEYFTPYNLISAQAV